MRVIVVLQSAVFRFFLRAARVHTICTLNCTTRQQPCRKRVYNGAGQPHRPVNPVYAIQRARYVSELVQQRPKRRFCYLQISRQPDVSRNALSFTAVLFNDD